MAERRNLPLEVKNLIFDYKNQGLSTGQISLKLKKLYGYQVTSSGIYKFLKRPHGRRKKRSDFKFGEGHQRVLHFWMCRNSDLTARDLQKKFFSTFGVTFGLSTIKRHRKLLNWCAKQKKYCQLISAKNKVVRLNWSLEKLQSGERFENVVFMDESNVELSSAGRLCFYQSGATIDRLPHKVAKPKHSYTVHVWAGISYKGRTNICIFTGIMDSVIYQKILEDNFLPFVRQKFPDGRYRLYQDNDSKHKSKSTREWMEKNGLLERVMETPASSPDINPIEMVWSDMKRFLQREVKPRIKDELIQGIKCYWETLTPQKCARYIDHIHKVLPVVVLNCGGPTED